MKNNLGLKVGIVIPTINRPDIVIRQLEYYAKVKSPHPVYIGDASNKENSKKLQTAIERLNPSLTINYYTHPEDIILSESHVFLYNQVKEEFCVFSGDDDYQIPNSLTKCAEFLKNNPDYSNASGHALTFRLIKKDVYGELKRLTDYPRYEIGSPSASQRLIDFMTKYNVNLFAVQRTKDMIRCWSQTNSIKEWNFANEALPCAVSAVLGKSKIIDCLGFLRQYDNEKIIHLKDTLDWMTQKDWNPAFKTFCKVLAKEISKIDGINIAEASKIPKQAFWSYLNATLPIEYNRVYPGPTSSRKKSNGSLPRRLRLYLGQNAPWLKNIYRKMAYSLPNAHRQIYHEVTQLSSPYNEDFQQVFNSFTGKYQDSSVV